MIGHGRGWDEQQRFRSVEEFCYVGGTACSEGKRMGHILWKMVDSGSVSF